MSHSSASALFASLACFILGTLKYRRAFTVELQWLKHLWTMTISSRRVVRPVVIIAPGQEA